MFEAQMYEIITVRGRKHEYDEMVYDCDVVGLTE